MHATSTYCISSSTILSRPSELDIVISPTVSRHFDSRPPYLDHTTLTTSSHSSRLPASLNLLRARSFPLHLPPHLHGHDGILPSLRDRLHENERDSALPATIRIHGHQFTIPIRSTSTSTPPGVVHEQHSYKVSPPELTRTTTSTKTSCLSTCLDGTTVPNILSYKSWFESLALFSNPSRRIHPTSHNHRLRFT